MPTGDVKNLFVKTLDGKEIPISELEVCDIKFEVNTDNISNSMTPVPKTFEITIRRANLFERAVDRVKRFFRRG